MKARILVIEDEMAINDLLCMNLEAAGYETVGYLDGNDASEGVAQGHEFQCALVDIMLPGKDGYTLLPELKMVRQEKVLDSYGTAPKQIQIDDVIIDTVSHIVTKNGEEIYLKPMEYNCLMVFVKNPNKALTRSQILQELWKEEFCGETRTVDAHVGRIRKKLSWQDKIKTIPRIGYRLEVDL